MTVSRMDKNSEPHSNILSFIFFLFTRRWCHHFPLAPYLNFPSILSSFALTVSPSFFFLSSSRNYLFMYDCEKLFPPLTVLTIVKKNFSHIYFLSSLKYDTDIKRFSISAFICAKSSQETQRETEG